VSSVKDMLLKKEDFFTAGPYDTAPVEQLLLPCVASDIANAKVAPHLFELEFLREKISTLFDAIAHGDDEHRRWLKEKIEAHFKRESWTCSTCQAENDRAQELGCPWCGMGE
jgi:rubrerythrin